MKLAVIGSRGFNDYELVKRSLNNINITLIISGGAKGADSLAERYASEFSIPTVIYKADWALYGRGAGVIRNTEIIQNAEVVIAFWDGVSKGTLDSIKKCEKFDKKLIQVIY